MSNSISSQLDFIKTIKKISTHKDNDNNINQSTDVSYKPLEIMVFTGYSEVDENGKIQSNIGNIKGVNNDNTYNDVQILGLGLGNNRGIYIPIKTNEFVLVGWISKTTPVILGSINDYITESTDNMPKIKEDELVIVSKEAGSSIFIKNDGTITVKTSDGSKIRLNNNGHFKLFNKDNYGIECDKDGNLIFRGVTITSTNTAGDF
jgi:hypothetical protein